MIHCWTKRIGLPSGRDTRTPDWVMRMPVRFICACNRSPAAEHGASRAEHCLAGPPAGSDSQPGSQVINTLEGKSTDYVLELRVPGFKQCSPSAANSTYLARPGARLRLVQNGVQEIPKSRTVALQFLRSIRGPSGRRKFVMKLDRSLAFLVYRYHFTKMEDGGSCSRQFLPNQTHSAMKQNRFSDDLPPVWLGLISCKTVLHQR